MIAYLAFAAVAVSSTSDVYSVQSLHVTGACIVDQMPRTARAVLAMDYRSPEYAEKLKALGANSGRCLPRRTKFSASGVLFAGSLAEAFLKLDVRRRDLATRIAYDPAREPIVARGAIEEVALCTAFKAPKATADLLQTQPATSGEDEAVRLLSPVIGECLQKDVKIEMNKPAIRSLLALAAYRIVTTPKKVTQ